MRYQNNMVFKRILASEKEATKPATYKGIFLKTLFFVGMTVVGAVLSLVLAHQNPSVFVTLLVGSSLGTTIFALVSMFSVRACKITGTLYCLCEGMLIGILSYLTESICGGAIAMALLSTIAVFGVVTLLFISNLVKVKGKFLRFLSVFATGYIVSMLLFLILNLFGVFPELSWEYALLFSLVTVFLASLYLFFDLENIRQVVEGGYPKEMEWTASFGLAFTLIWLYVEILRLILIMAVNRRD